MPLLLPALLPPIQMRMEHPVTQPRLRTPPLPLLILPPGIVEALAVGNPTYTNWLKVGVTSLQ